jgi:hypothetical protein
MTSADEERVRRADEQSTQAFRIARMAELPTAKMAHEFLCRTETEPGGREFLASPVWTRWLRAKFPELDPETGLIRPAPRRPVVGDRVLYVSYGSPGGRYRPAERAATVTEAGAWVDVEVRTFGSVDPAPGEMQLVRRIWDPFAVHLFVMNPTGQHCPAPVDYDGGRPAEAEDPGVAVPGNRFGDRVYEGGTWHWAPEPQVTLNFTPTEIALDSDLQKRLERLAAGHCPEHGDQCASWVPTAGGGGTHVGPPRWKNLG